MSTVTLPAQLTPNVVPTTSVNLSLTLELPNQIYSFPVGLGRTFKVRSPTVGSVDPVLSVVSGTSPPTDEPFNVDDWERAENEQPFSGACAGMLYMWTNTPNTTVDLELA